MLRPLALPSVSDGLWEIRKMTVWTKKWYVLGEE